MLGIATADALPDRDLTAKLLLDNLPPGQDIFYRVRFEAIADSGTCGEARIGHFRTPARIRDSVSFLWSGDTAGQGWGIDPARGGMRTYRTMLENRPDFFIHCGDHIYADCPVPGELTLPNGEIWRNLVTEEKSEVGARRRCFACGTNRSAKYCFAATLSACTEDESYSPRTRSW